MHNLSILLFIYARGPTQPSSPQSSPCLGHTSRSSCICKISPRQSSAGTYCMGTQMNTNTDYMYYLTSMVQAPSLRNSGVSEIAMEQ